MKSIHFGKAAWVLRPCARSSTETEKLCVLRMVFISSVRGGMCSRGMRKVAELNRSMKTYIIIGCVCQYEDGITRLSELTLYRSLMVDLRYWYPDEPPVPTCMEPSIRCTS